MLAYQGFHAKTSHEPGTDNSDVLSIIFDEKINYCFRQNSAAGSQLENEILDIMQRSGLEQPTPEFHSQQFCSIFVTIDWRMDTTPVANAKHLVWTFPFLTRTTRCEGWMLFRGYRRWARHHVSDIPKRMQGVTGRV
jgi:hypothetical protein